jgi:hypothetical protein
MANALTRTGWVAAIVLGLGAFGAWPLAGAAAQRSAATPAGPAAHAAPVSAAPSRFLAPEPQVVYDEGLQVTFGVAADERGRTVLSAESSRVQVKKMIEPNQTTLDLATPDGDRLRLVARRDSVTVQHGAQSVTITLPATAQDFARMRALLGGSGAARTFRALSGAVQARHAEPFFDGIVTSGALIGVLNGDDRAVDALKARFAARRGPRVQPVAWQSTPNECWRVYSADAIDIYDEYDDCMGRTRWYDISDRSNCQLIYVTRAELAFSWLISCSGGFLGR